MGTGHRHFLSMASQQERQRPHPSLLIDATYPISRFLWTSYRVLYCVVNLCRMNDHTFISFGPTIQPFMNSE